MALDHLVWAMGEMGNISGPDFRHKLKRSAREVCLSQSLLSTQSLSSCTTNESQNSLLSESVYSREEEEEDLGDQRKLLKRRCLDIIDDVFHQMDDFDLGDGVDIENESFDSNYTIIDPEDGSSDVEEGIDCVESSRASRQKVVRKRIS